MWAKLLQAEFKVHCIPVFTWDFLEKIQCTEAMPTCGQFGMAANITVVIAG